MSNVLADLIHNWRKSAQSRCNFSSAHWLLRQPIIRCEQKQWLLYRWGDAAVEVKILNGHLSKQAELLLPLIQNCWPPRGWSDNSRGWEEPVEIEWKRIEFFISVVSSECSELHPPRHTSILLWFLYFQSVVKKHSNNQPHGCWWWKYCVQVCIEL